MAKNINVIKTEATTIRDEVVPEQNTSLRIGTVLLDIIDWVNDTVWAGVQTTLNSWVSSIQTAISTANTAATTANNAATYATNKANAIDTSASYANAAGGAAANAAINANAAAAEARSAANSANSKINAANSAANAANAAANAANAAANAANSAAINANAAASTANASAANANSKAAAANSAANAANAAAQNANNKANAIDTSASNANAAANAANNAAINANAATSAANASAANANSKADAANAATSAANTAATNANSKAADANAATAAANTATGTANAAATNANSAAQTAVETANSAAQTAVETANSAAQTAVETANSAAQTAVETANSAAQEAVNTANSAAQEAVNTANSAAQEAVNTANSAAQAAVYAANSAAQTANVAAEKANIKANRAEEVTNQIEEAFDFYAKNTLNNVFYLFTTMPDLNKVEKFNHTFFNKKGGLLRVATLVYGTDKQGNPATGIILAIEDDSVYLKTTMIGIPEAIISATQSVVIPSGATIPVVIDGADASARTIVEAVATRDGVSVGITIDIINHDGKLIAIETKRVSSGNTNNGLTVAPQLVANTLRLSADTASITFTYTVRNIVGNMPGSYKPVIISGGQSKKISIPNLSTNIRTLIEYVAIHNWVSVGGTIDIVNGSVSETRRVTDEDTNNGLVIAPTLTGNAITVSADDAGDILFVYSLEALNEPVVNIPAGQIVAVPIDKAVISKRSIVHYIARRDGATIGGTLEIIYNNGIHQIIESRISDGDSELGFEIEPALVDGAIVISADNSSASDLEFICTTQNLVVTATPNEQVVIPRGQSLSINIPNSDLSARTIVEYEATRNGEIVLGTIDILNDNGKRIAIETKRTAEGDTNNGLIIEPLLTGDYLTMSADMSGDDDILLDYTARNIEDSPNSPVLVSAGTSEQIAIGNSENSARTVVEYAVTRSGKTMGGTIQIVNESGTYNVFETKRVNDEDTDFGFAISDTLAGDAITISETTGDSDIEFVFYVANQEA